MSSGKTIILVPIYQADPPALERYSLEYSLARLGKHELAFIGPQGLDLAYYKERFPERPFIAYDPSYFASIKGYNLLLLSADFYERFQGSHEFMLILQTDAVVLRDELAAWEKQPYDYVGAPWPDGVEILVNLERFAAVGGKKVRAHVGNGGFSLRRIRKCVELLKEFPQARETFWRTGSSEDLFFSIMGGLSADFVLPGEIAASRFALELQPQNYLAMNGGREPMAGHAWWKYDPWFWAERFEGVVPFRFPPRPQPAAAAATGSAAS